MTTTLLPVTNCDHMPDSWCLVCVETLAQTAALASNSQEIAWQQVEQLTTLAKAVPLLTERIAKLEEAESDADALREIIDKYDRDLRKARIENMNLVAERDALQRCNHDLMRQRSIAWREVPS